MTQLDRGSYIANGFFQDVRFGIRILRKHAVSSATVILAIGLGIGANTVVFSVVEAVLIRRLPFRQPGRLVMLWQTDPERPSARMVTCSFPNFSDWKLENNVFDDMGFYDYRTFDINGDFEPERVRGVAVSPNLFGLLGVRPFIGAGFSEGIGRVEEENQALIGFGLWKRLYGSDAGILGRTIVVDGSPCTVTGVAPAGFHFPFGAELWTTLKDSPNGKRDQRGSTYLYVMGRLKPGVTLKAAQSEMDIVARNIRNVSPDGGNYSGIAISPLDEVATGGYRGSLLLLQAAVGLVLLIALANISAVVLALGQARRREVAIRVALGARAWQLLRQFFVENLFLTASGGGVALVVAYWVDSWLRVVRPRIPRIEDAQLDLLVLGATACVSLLAGAVTALAQFAHFRRSRTVTGLLVPSTQRSAPRKTQGMMQFLVFVEVALAVVLLIATGLVVKTFLRISSTDPGFNTSNLTTMEISLPSHRYSDAGSQAAFISGALAGIRAIGGVRSAGMVSSLPFSGSGVSRNFTISEMPDLPYESPSASYLIASSAYFRTMGIALVGRDFSDRDGRDAPGVAIVNRKFVGLYMQDQNPIGKHLQLGGVTLEVVGVAGNSKRLALTGLVEPEIYVPYSQAAGLSVNFVVDREPSAKGVMAALRSVIAREDKNLPIGDFETMSDRVARSVKEPKEFALMMSSISAIAFGLSVIGVFATVSYCVSQRRRDIGIRRALGATRANIVALMMRIGMAPTMAGLVVGTVSALALTRFLRSLLYGLSTEDPGIYITIILSFTLATLLVCAVASWRALYLDPWNEIRV